MFMRDPGKNGKPLAAGAWIALGTAIGCGLGVASGNLALGVGLGVALGAVIALASRRRNDRPNP